MFAQSAFALVLVAVSVAVGAHAQEPNCARNYTVVSGDTCDGICAKTSVSSFQLATVNADKIDALCDNLSIGEPLCLGIRGQDCQVTHVVQSGDTCQAIVDNAGTTLDILLANNPNVNSECTNIHPGEVLCTADDVIVVPPSSSTTSTLQSSTPTTSSTTIKIATTSTA